MNIELVILGGYGQFVWPAFIFAFVCCFSLYVKTRKELKKQEKLFLIKSRQILVARADIVEQKKISRELLSANLTC